MCTLIAFWRSVPGYGIVIGMNRDESSMRPADPPAVLDGTPMIVAPRDRQAGGTWLRGGGGAAPRAPPPPPGARQAPPPPPPPQRPPPPPPPRGRTNAGQPG